MINSNESFSTILYTQFEHASNEPNCTFLNFMYGLINDKLVSRGKSDKIIEIGSGPGVSAKFIKHANILRTDLLAWEDSKIPIQPRVNAHALPFRDNEFGALFAVDTIHHLSDPIFAICEMQRVVKNGGLLIFIEPYISFLSYPIYKLFHHESSSWSFSQKSFNSAVSDLAGDGDQGIPKFLFTNNEMVNQITNGSRGLDLDIMLFAPFSFFATGGLSKPLPVPRSLIKFLISIESKIPQIFMRYVASRMLISLKITK